MIYIFLANGFEEIEALAPYDILKRAGANVLLAGVGIKTIKSAKGLVVSADISEEEVALDTNLELVVLPGGRGADNLKNSEFVKRACEYAYKNAKVAAICASPHILASWGMLNGKEATVFPDEGYIKELAQAKYVNKSVVTCDNVTTANGAGASLEFGFELVRILYGKEEAKRIASAMQCK